ncbi:ArsA family ATPase [Fervidibacter sacchari]|uniref:Arsenite-transporting ATPase n=1 Tax=Candidatus Fervidibacter sacchari TaxID=1448929 RepID=A0ABT2ELX4_9BACT|nr:ArsA family ATPase [Candidatus Fervidibacter sacchari]MCS3917953.1 arsenite-transporting ATPase [Candidatus Fervidibacter sacchari]WKU15769.1 ArsA family ATPase [Candidatus Fervidibacter sacchari]
MRVLLYTGKGGVGKTSVSAATALKCAEFGYRTLVMSTDPAHSLADSFAMPIKSEPTPLTENLWGLEIDPFREIEENWATVKDYLSTLFASQGVDDIVAEELSILPGMDELFSLLKIRQFYERDAYDVIVVDCAPTGATLRLLHFPDMIGWYMRRLFHVERKVVGTIRRFTDEIFSVPLPGDEVYDTVERLYKRVGDMKAVLADPKITSIRLVLNPEKMVIEETRRAYTYLNLFGFVCDAVIANKVLPEEVTDEYFAEWKASQQRYLEEVEASFGALPIFKVRLYEREVVGIDALRQMANDLYGDRDPTEHFADSKPMRIVKRGKDYWLELHLPFTEKGEIQLMRKGDELIIRVGTIKRHLVLPHILAKQEPKGAKLENGILQVRFGKD